MILAKDLIGILEKPYCPSAEWCMPMGPCTPRNPHTKATTYFGIKADLMYGN